MGFLDRFKGMGFGGKSHPLGIEIGSSAIKVVDMAEKGGGFVLNGAHVVPIPRGLVTGGVIKDENKDRMVSELEELRELVGIKKGEVAFALPGNFSIIETFALQGVPDEDEIRSQVEKRVAATIPLKREELTFDFDVYLPEDGEENSQVVYAIARREMVDSYRYILEAAGFTLESVKPTPVCLANVVAANTYFSKGEVILLLEIGGESTNLLVMKDGRILYSRNVSIGGSVVTQMIADKLGLSFEDAEKMKLNAGDADRTTLRDAAVALAVKLQDEVGVSLGQIEGALGTGLELKRVLLTGGGAKTIFLEEELQSVLGVQVEGLIPIKNIALSPALDPLVLAEIAPRISTAIGLLLKA